jgi:DUF2075 family protein
MTDFSIESIPFNSESISELGLLDSMHRNWPVVYTLSNSNEIYVGETVNAASRLSQHFSSDSKKGLNLVRIFFNSRFNKSACLDLESQLIRLFAADEKFKVLNSNLGISDANYFDKEEYSESFNLLFEELRLQGWLTRTVPELVNSNLFKYSPFKTLNSEQAQAVSSILESLIKSRNTKTAGPIVIEGDPGTGKTIVAIYLIKLLQDISHLSDENVIDSDSVFAEYLTSANRDLFKDMRIGLVIPQQALRATLTKVFSKTPGLRREMILTPFAVGSSDERWDLLIVDETHRLGMRAQQPHPSLNLMFGNNNVKLFGDDDNKYTQLDWVIQQSRAQVLLMDRAQTIKPADLPRNILEEVIAESKNSGKFIKLASQMRVQGGEDYIEFIRKLFTEDPKNNPGFGDYDLKFFDSFTEMREQIIAMEKSHGLSRIIAGYAWDWVSKKDPTVPDIEIENTKLFWNRTDKDWVNSSTAIEEVGGIHTIQGYDLNYAGVIIGKDLGYDPNTKRIVFNRSNYFDANGKINNKKLGITYSDDDIRNWVINIYRVLLTRGIRGTYIYVVDPKLREFFRTRINDS